MPPKSLSVRLGDPIRVTVSRWRRRSGSSRWNRACSERTVSTALRWARVNRYVRRVPRAASKRSGDCQNPTKTSCTVSSASVSLRSTRSAIDGAIEGALLTGDDQIIVDMLDWQEKSLEAHGLDGSVVVEALAPPLAELSDEGSAALTRAREVRAG